MPDTIDSRFLISIHALREESDTVDVVTPPRGFEISIHALREESDILNCLGVHCAIEFQSTLSVRRATVGDYSQSNNPIYFNPRSP